MHSLKKKLVTAAAAVGAAGLVLAGGPAVAASASTAPGNGGHHGQEFIRGFLRGPTAVSSAPIVPLRLSGVVNARGSINLGGNSSVADIPTFKGTLAVEHGNPSPPPQINHRTCRATDTIHTWTRVLGSRSSGVFRGARGRGRATAAFSYILPRLNNGKCDLNARPERHRALILFYAHGSLQLRHHHDHQ